MNLTTKYNIKMIWDQFGHRVSQDFCDFSEVELLTSFEECINIIQTSQKNTYTMIELGSNWAYYSCVFKAAFGNINSKCFMVEPLIENMNRGKEHFAANNFDGVFINKLVGRGIAHSSNAKDDDKIHLTELMSRSSI